MSNNNQDQGSAKAVPSNNAGISGSAAQKVSNSGKGTAHGGMSSPGGGTGGYGGNSSGGANSTMPTPSGPSKGDGNKATTAFGNDRTSTQTANNGGTTATGSGATGGHSKDRSRDLSTAKTAQSTTANANPNANRTIGHYVVGK